MCMVGYRKSVWHRPSRKWPRVCYQKQSVPHASPTPPPLPKKTPQHLSYMRRWGWYVGMEAAGIEPHASGAPTDASSTHLHAQTTHFRAWRSSRAPDPPPYNAPRLHEQHTDVHGQRARSVHTDHDLATVIAAWP